MRRMWSSACASPSVETGFVPFSCDTYDAVSKPILKFLLFSKVAAALKGRTTTTTTTPFSLLFEIGFIVAAMGVDFRIEILSFLDRCYKSLFLLLFSYRGYDIPREMTGKQERLPMTLATLETLIWLGSFSFVCKLGPQISGSLQGGPRYSRRSRRFSFFLRSPSFDS